MHNAPIIGPVVRYASRARTALGYFREPLVNLVKWLFKSNETTNFTYDLEEANKRYLASLIADIAKIEFVSAMAYIEELESDEELREHIAEATAKSGLAARADKTARYGRRLGWYALARASKPKIIIETGVDKGLGACVLTAALKRNMEEGFGGRYYGTDIDPGAGYLLSGAYADFGEIIFGDSIESLNTLEGSIDLFINDSDHSAAYEASEYQAIAGKLSDNAIVLGDNSHCTDKLLEFSLQANRHFIFFQEKPRDHWYPGAGIGISFKR